MSAPSSEPQAPSAAPKLPPEGSFGRIVIDFGFMSVEQLDEALRIQAERQERGDFARLGHILVEKGYLTPGQVQEVLEAQKIVILLCGGCGTQYNIRGYSPRFHYECPRCHGELKPGTVDSVMVEDQLQAKHTDTKVLLTRPDETNTAKIRMLKRLGKYEILGEIARGGMGIIYKALQPDLDRIVAVKTLRQEELGKDDASQGFMQEAQAVAQLRHPSIVGVHEVGQFRGIQYFTMDFIEGLPLDRMLLREPLEPHRAVEVVLAIAEALQYAHRKGVVHRDLKPANIIVASEDGSPFLVDFGIAKKIATEGPRQLYDEEEDLLGSIPYMAPEYVEGSAYDELCDLYSLGVVLYESLAGGNSLPYYDDDTRRFLEKIITCEFKPITEWVPGLDPELVNIVERMICARDRRYPSMNAAARALRRWLVANDNMTPIGGYRTLKRAAVAAAEAALEAQPAEVPNRHSDETPVATPRVVTPDPDAEPDEDDLGAALEGDTEIVHKRESLGPSAAPAPAAPEEPPYTPPPEVGRSTTFLVLLLFAALAAIAWTRSEFDELKQELRLQRQAADEATRTHRDALILTQLEQARRLEDLGHDEQALGLCDAILGGTSNPSNAALAPVYRLRAALKRELGRAGAEDDLKRAEQLEK